MSIVQSFQGREEAGRRRIVHEECAPRERSIALCELMQRFQLFNYIVHDNERNGEEDSKDGG